MTEGDDMDPVEQSWCRLQERWSEEEAHRQFIGLCVSLERLADAGRLYAQVRDHEPERTEEARWRIDQVQTVAWRSIEVLKAPPRDPQRRRGIYWVALLVFFALMGVSAWGLLAMR